MADSYEAILEAERAKHHEVKGNWPESLELNGETFVVLYGLNESREIEGFALVDGEGNQLFEVELSVVYLIEEHIWEIIIWEFGGIYSFRIRTKRERKLYEDIFAEYSDLRS